MDSSSVALAFGRRTCIFPNPDYIDIKMKKKKKHFYSFIKRSKSI